MDESRRSDAQLSKSGREKQIPHYLTDIQNLKNKKQRNGKTQKVDTWLPAARVVGVCDIGVGEEETRISHNTANQSWGRYHPAQGVWAIIP